MSKFALLTSNTAINNQKHMPEGNCARRDKREGAHQPSQCGSALQELAAICRVLTNAQHGKAAEVQNDKCKTLCTGV